MNYKNTAEFALSLDAKDELKNYSVGEYFSILAIMALGLFLMASAIDILMVYISLEIVSIMSFFLAGYLKKSQLSNEASLKYVIYGAFSSGIMLFGFSILFGLTIILLGLIIWMAYEGVNKVLEIRRTS